jgi:hypothetical protein
MFQSVQKAPTNYATKVCFPVGEGFPFLCNEKNQFWSYSMKTVGSFPGKIAASMSSSLCPCSTLYHCSSWAQRQF